MEAGASAAQRTDARGPPIGRWRDNGVVQQPKPQPGAKRPDGRKRQLLRFVGAAVVAVLLVVGAADGARILSAACFGLIGLGCVAANRELAPAFSAASEAALGWSSRAAAVALGAFFILGGIVRLG